MANITLKQGKDYVRSKVKELKNDSIFDNMLTIDFNLAIVKVQADLQELEIKNFIKTIYKSNPVGLLPDDILPVPNSIKDVRASAGVKATVSTAIAGVKNDVTFTAVEPGTVGNGIVIQYISDGTEIIKVTSVDMALKIITVSFESGLPEEERTALQVIEAINIDMVSSSLVKASLKDGNDGTGGIEATIVTTAGGTGSGWKPADERTIKDSNRMEASTIENSSVNFPKYVIKGDIYENRIIELYPKTIKYFEMTYAYTIAEMTTDEDVLSIPLLYRELVLIEVIRKAYESLDMAEKMASRMVEYQSKLEKIQSNYQKGLQASIQEKKRIQMED